MFRHHSQAAGGGDKVGRMAGTASENTPGVGTGHACQALDGCLQPERFDSSVLRRGRPTKMGLSNLRSVSL